MKFKIHRGTKEIGGSCVEVWTENTRIVIDIGMPLVNSDGTEFNFRKYQKLSTQELVKQQILPNIKGLYENDINIIDGILLSHAHIDHYGFNTFINPQIKFYMGEATHKIIQLSSIFTPQDNIIFNFQYFKKSKPFKIGDMIITPFGMDHSAFDSYGFLIEADGKSIFYSGDFRSHGRKSNVYARFLKNLPKNIDYLLLEGTQVGRSNTVSISETDIEAEMTKIFSKNDKINLVYTSGQNIDRLVSIFKACNNTNKIFVIDVYVATILKELSKFASIPYPSDSFKNVRVIFPPGICNMLKRKNNENIFYQFRKYKISHEELSDNYRDIVMIVRPSIKNYITGIKNLNKGNFIYSLWKGYLKKDYTKSFVDYFTNMGFDFHIIHTSGHADTMTLKKMVSAIKPKNIVPIHTFEADEYANLFLGSNVLQINDNKIVSMN